jgi:hypothetical protein
VECDSKDAKVSALSPLWLAAGATAGIVHAWLLWQAAKASATTWRKLPASGPKLAASATKRSGLLPAFRWLVVVAVLATAAVLGELLPAVIGWGIAYAATVGIVAVRGRT